MIAPELAFALGALEREDLLLQASVVANASVATAITIILFDQLDEYG